MKRRKFIENTALTSLGLTMISCLESCNDTKSKSKAISEEKVISVQDEKPNPIVVCTWGFADANARAGEAIAAGKNALDAVIEGVSVEEENLRNSTVGNGGAPDRDGRVTLDACVMNPQGNYGAVLCVENITNVASLAKKVMEETPHVILAAEGAEEFAYQQGFEKQNLLTPESKEAWEEWKKTSDYKPVINIENHDTIGMLAIDQNGDIAGACTTSGLAYKMKGRVGDSAIIGSGLFIDNEVGGAVATGMGEEVLKTVGSFLIVELMRNGMSPQQACEEAIKRIVTKNSDHKNFQVAYVALNKAGEVGHHCIHKGFSVMKYQNGKNENIPASFHINS